MSRVQMHLLLAAILAAFRGAVITAVASAEEKAPSRSSLVTILRGLEAREKAARAQLESAKGLWEVESSVRQGLFDDKGNPIRWPPDLSKTWIERRSARVYSAFAGEAYREAERILEPEESRSAEIWGCDGETGWWCGSTPWGKRCVTRGRQEICWLRMADYTGLFELLREDPAHRLSAQGREGGPHLVDEESLDGRKCYVIRFRRPRSELNRTITIWVCPDYGYAVVRRGETRETPPKHRPPHSMVRETTMYSGFREYAAGLWLPGSFSFVMEHRPLPDGSWFVQESRRGHATALKVNVHLDPAQFQRPEGPPE